MKKCSSCGREFQEQTTFCPFDGKKLDSPEVATEVDKFLGMVLDGKYCVESKIGQGGMGNVYKAKHVHMDTMVAVKILHPHLVSDQTTVERFRREARAAITVNHPNAIHVMDFGVTGDKTVYLVMEFLEGVSLRKILETDKYMAPDRAINVIKQVCAAVEAAHIKNIIHRDLKPDNIVILDCGTPNEQIKVLDFSIAKLKVATEGPVNLTQQGMVVGTPQYMSPEQAEGQELDIRSDLYSLGVIVYEMLTGDLPFKATTPMALILKHIHALPRPLRELKDDISPALEAVVLRTLAKKREDRPQSAAQLADQLEEALHQQHIPTRSDTTPVVVRPTGDSMSALGKSNIPKSTQPVVGAASYSGATAPLKMPVDSNLPNIGSTSGALDYSGDYSLDPSRGPSKVPNSINRPQNGNRSISPFVSSSPNMVQGQESLIEVKPDGVKRLIVIVGGALFALVVGLTIYFFFFNRPDGGNDTPVNTSNNPKAWIEKLQMVTLPMGTFMMGADKGAADDATPAHSVKVPAFVIGRYEVTNREYREYIRATNRPSPLGWTGTEYPTGQDDFPVSNITWDEANAYCAWLSSVSGMRFRMPTEAEWEYAARGTDNRFYPWGEEWDANKTIFGDNSGAAAKAVNNPQLSGDRSPFGVIGMSGNVAEWTNSDFKPYQNTRYQLKESDAGCKVIRGGNYQTKKKEYLSSVSRVWQPNDYKNERLGFRLAADLPN
ncbi:MAG: SUMF1/EgtB/PvdO family nonheme iron enzyme [Acidobacteria bacterium]|nr:SUMF1/EgtB/PvdO family nonheme iron enzyme [Acidobacteriota bacterium]